MKKLMLIAAVAAIAANSAFAAPDTGKSDRPHKAHMGFMFEKMDSDKDGKITQAEFMANAEARFKAMDTNNDGVVDKDEAKQMAQKRKAEMKKHMQNWKEKHGHTGNQGAAPAADKAE